MRFVRVSLIVLTALILASLSVISFCAEEASPELSPRQLGQQVDVLQMVVDLQLDENQIKVLASKATALKQKREELQKREDEILASIKEPLRQMRDKLAAGQPVPSSVSSVAEAKLKELQELRMSYQKELMSAAGAVNQLMTEKQIRILTRSPEAQKRAAEIVAEVRSTPEDKWPQKLSELTAELVEIGKVDKKVEWDKAEKEKLEGLTGEERENARKELEKQRETDVKQMETEISQLLTKIRFADSKLRQIAINNVCSYLRPKLEVRMQLFDMLVGILNNPGAADALNARVAHLTTAGSGSEK